jgi:hypothetical protein
MRPRSAWPVLLLGLLLLAGCNEADPAGDGGETRLESTGPGPTDSEDAGDVPDPDEGFAVLVVDGRLEGQGPSPDSVAACDLAPADGQVDLDAKTVWARPGRHSFKAGQTWLLVLDRVEVDDPRISGCDVRRLTAFTATGTWEPQVGEGAFHLEVSPDGDRLLVGRNAVEPGGEFETYAEFEDGEYTFSGDLTFKHQGWWPPTAFEEKDAEAPFDDKAVWWT